MVQLGENKARNKVSADDEENVDADESSRHPCRIDMKENDKADGERPQAIDVGTAILRRPWATRRGS